MQAGEPSSPDEVITFGAGPPTTAVSPLAHPDTLWYAALVAGLRAAHPERCRLLELGCGDGTNLLPIAYRLPAAELTGVEADAALLERARAGAAALDIGHLELQVADPLEPLAAAPFDYVLAPDLLLRPGARAEPVLAQLAATLAPTGVAFLAYASEPGRMMRHALAASVRCSAGSAADAEQAIRLAREAIEAIGSELPPGEHPYAHHLAAELVRAAHLDDHNLFYDYVLPPPTTYWRHDLAALAAAAGLEVIADLGPTTDDPRLGHALRRDLARRGPLEVIETWADLIQGRETHWLALAPATEGERVRPPLGAPQLLAGQLFSPLIPTEPDPWLGPRAGVDFLTLEGHPYRVEEPLLKAALLALGRAWPSGLTFAELAQDVQNLLASTPGAGGALGDEGTQRLAFLLLEPLRHRFVRLGPRAPAGAQSREGPRVSALTKLEAERGPELTGAHHDVAPFEPIDRFLIGQLDGRPLPELAAHLRALVDDGTLTFDDGQEPWPARELLHFFDERLPLLITRLHQLGTLT